MLYKDPNGEKVFSSSEEKARQMSSILEGTPLGENEFNNLKKKIQHLEDVVAEYQVCIGHSHNIFLTCYKNCQLFVSTLPLFGNKSEESRLEC